VLIHVYIERASRLPWPCLLDELDRLIMSVNIHPFAYRAAAPSKDMTAHLCFATKRAVAYHQRGAGVDAQDREPLN
jgi:hypothetical protein